MCVKACLEMLCVYGVSCCTEYTKPVLLSTCSTCLTLYRDTRNQSFSDSLYFVIQHFSVCLLYVVCEIRSMIQGCWQVCKRGFTPGWGVVHLKCSLSDTHPLQDHYLCVCWWVSLVMKATDRGQLRSQTKPEPIRKGEGLWLMTSYFGTHVRATGAHKHRQTDRHVRMHACSTCLLTSRERNSRPIALCLDPWSSYMIMWWPEDACGQPPTPRSLCVVAFN